MQFEKRQVRLGDIRPSEQNPREDFGDIGALARSIEATGGEPLNPPVVVADGNVYRIVDGERRYRALSSIYGEDREVSALVADTMDEANELVAMLATDDKRQLTEAERARGVQQMLVLGVDEQRIERASRATAGQIRAARKLRGRIDAGAQVTLEQLEAASAFDDEKDVEAVLAAGEGWAGKADSIRRRNEREKAALEGLYRRMVGFITSGAFTMPDDLKRIVREARVEPVVMADAIGGDPSFETDKRIAGVREEFMARLGTSGPSEYEAGFRLMAAARDMVRLNSSYSGDDAEGWLEHWEMFRSAGFEPGGDDEWLMARVQESAKEEKDE